MVSHGIGTAIVPMIIPLINNTQGPKSKAYRKNQPLTIGNVMGGMVGQKRRQALTVHQPC